jgi:hypothetical protein
MNIKMIPNVLWVLNIMVSCVEHTIAGPGLVIPTPLQRFVAALFTPELGLERAQFVAN